MTKKQRIIINAACVIVNAVGVLFWANKGNTGWTIFCSCALVIAIINILIDWKENKK